VSKKKKPVQSDADYFGMGPDLADKHLSEATEIKMHVANAAAMLEEDGEAELWGYYIYPGSLFGYEVDGPGLEDEFFEELRDAVAAIKVKHDKQYNATHVQEPIKPRKAPKPDLNAKAKRELKPRSADDYEFYKPKRHAPVQDSGRPVTRASATKGMKEAEVKALKKQQQAKSKAKLDVPFLADRPVEMALLQVIRIREMIDKLPQATRNIAPDFFKDVYNHATDVGETIRRQNKVSAKQLRALTNWENGVRKWIH